MARADWQQKTIKVCGTELSYLRAGKGKPVLVLHEELGNPGWFAWQRRLAETREVIVPLHPGFGVSPRIDWVRSVGDLANFYAQVLAQQVEQRAFQRRQRVDGGAQVEGLQAAAGSRRKWRRRIRRNSPP